jgi:PAS domain S-box-containing protein
MLEERTPVKLRAYVWSVIAAGFVLLATNWPAHIAAPALYVQLFALTLVTSCFKIRVPLLRGWANMSPTEIFPFLTLLLLGLEAALPMAAAGAALQSAFHSRNPKRVDRHLFNAAALVLTVLAVDWALRALGGVPGEPRSTLRVVPLVGATTTYFLANSALVALAVAWSTGQPPWSCWHENFLWSAPAYYLSLGLAGLGALLIQEGVEPAAALVLAVPAFLTYRAYRMYFRRVRQDQERLLVTLGSIHEAVITTDLQGRVLLWNRIAEQLTGVARQDSEGKPLAELLDLVDPLIPARRCNPMSQLLVRGRLDPDAVYELRLPDARPARTVEIGGSVLVDTDGRRFGTVLVMRDITTRLRAEQERMKAGKLESMSLLAGGIAHDFNNVLTTILGSITLARSDASLPPSVAPLLDDAVGACQRAEALTRQLLTLSRDASTLRRPIALGPLLAEAADFALRGTATTVDLRLADDLAPVRADPEQLERVFENLVRNASQAMRGRGRVIVTARNVEPGPTVRSDGTSAADQVEVLVEDRGRGIPRENLTKVFEPYFTTRSTGTGLGLASANAIVTSHGGHIDVVSTVGEGTTFTVALPACRTPSADLTPEPRGGAEDDRPVRSVVDRRGRDA